jgi:hypothetical protein
MQAVLHYPRLDTVLMVEEVIREHKEYPTKKQLWESLPKKVMYQTFNVILDYLQDSGKIMIDDGQIIWIWNPRRVKELMSKDLLVR